VGLGNRLAALGAAVAGTRGAVLCFHGLDIDREPSRSSMHVSHEQFSAIVSAARRVGTLVPLSALIQRHRAGESTAGLIAMTADDTYASWLAAEFLLRSLEAPLTFFAVGNALAEGQVFWWDRIEEVADLANEDQWREFEEGAGLPDAYRGQAREGRARPMRQWLLAAHAGRLPAEADAALSRLERHLNRRTRQRAMTAVELAGFLGRTGAELAVHTASHAALPFLPDDQVVAEVREGFHALRTRFPETLPYLAIPFGLFDARTGALAATAGMEASLTLEGDPLDRPFDAAVGVSRLCVVREQEAGKIALKLSQAAGVIRRLRGHATASRFPVLPSPTT
jgi:peptidoglycan/xylan/chitin deacetylase (PgdA/CDA1 family)